MAIGMKAMRITDNDWLPVSTASHPIVAASENAGAVDARPMMTELTRPTAFFSSPLPL